MNMMGSKGQILLHSCCAPCSAAILEWLQNNDFQTTILFYNPNIYPAEEYFKRKEEIVKYANALGIKIVDFDDENWEESHQRWVDQLSYLSQEPERGKRCLECFKIRLLKSAEYAAEHSIPIFTTTLASSRWKNLEQIIQAGRYAASMYPSVEFWEKNWRKGGLYERRNELSKQFYNQKYCGCEYSMRYTL